MSLDVPFLVILVAVVGAACGVWLALEADHE